MKIRCRDCKYYGIDTVNYVCETTGDSRLIFPHDACKKESETIIRFNPITGEKRIVAYRSCHAKNENGDCKDFIEASAWLKFWWWCR